MTRTIWLHFGWGTDTDPANQWDTKRKLFSLEEGMHSSECRSSFRWFQLCQSSSGLTLLLYAAQGCGVVSWLSVWLCRWCNAPCRLSGICNLFRVPVIARLLVTKNCGIFNVHQLMTTVGMPSSTPIRGTAHTDESPYMWSTRIIVYSWVGIQTQARHLRGECVYL